MIGSGVLRECLLDPRVAGVLAVGRSACGVKSAKLDEIVLPDLFQSSGVAERLAGLDACFYCLGISSAGVGEAAYTRVTLDLTREIARVLLFASPGVRMCFVSGAGADASERSRTMWRRVKGRAENAVLALPFAQATVFRPGIIQPLHGITSRTRAYRALYTAFSPLWPLLHALAPAHVTTTERIGRAMLQVALAGSTQRVLETREINAAASALPPARP
jgi:uncharacterized protein YbjT (DUF2867 family)